MWVAFWGWYFSEHNASWAAFQSQWGSGGGLGNCLAISLVLPASVCVGFFDRWSWRTAGTVYAPGASTTFPAWGGKDDSPETFPTVCATRSGSAGSCVGLHGDVLFMGGVV